MEIRSFILAAVLLIILAVNASAYDYLAPLRELDQSLICIIAIFVPGVMALFFFGAGLLYITGEEGNRALAKNLIKNAVLGLLLTVIFILLSMALLPTISLNNCLR